MCRGVKYECMFLFCTSARVYVCVCVDIYNMHILLILRILLQLNVPSVAAATTTDGRLTKWKRAVSVFFAYVLPAQLQQPCQYLSMYDWRPLWPRWRIPINDSHKLFRRRFSFFFLSIFFALRLHGCIWHFNFHPIIFGAASAGKHHSHALDSVQKLQHMCMA